MVINRTTEEDCEDHVQYVQVHHWHTQTEKGALFHQR